MIIAFGACGKMRNNRQSHRARSSILFLSFFVLLLCFLVSTVRPTVHTNPSRKLSFLKIFENAVQTGGI